MPPPRLALSGLARMGLLGLRCASLLRLPGLALLCRALRHQPVLAGRLLPARRLPALF